MEKGMVVDGRYTLLRPLGTGLSGEVFEVEDEEGKKALKFLKRVQMNVSRDEALDSFKNEFATLSELNHPNIARILDFGYDSKLEKYFFTSEFIDGKDFFKATQDTTFDQIEDLAIQALRALNYLHLRGIYHFDIKPQNMLVDTEDGKLRVKLIDFGLAGFESPRKKVGTPAYMAPEVLLGSTLDGRTDLYSFGVVLYKALTKTNPFLKKESRETLAMQRTFVPPPVTAVDSNIPAFWDVICQRLLEKNPSDRYPDAQSVIRDINFLANKHYEVETLSTRLSYIPEKGILVARKKEIETFKKIFESVFDRDDPMAKHLLLVTGPSGTGKTRLLSEFKYYSQLHDVPILTLKSYQSTPREAPFCLLLDDEDEATPDIVNEILREYIEDKILIVWATRKAPSYGNQYEKFLLGNFNERELANYLGMVTGLQDVPPRLVSEIYARTDGNPLFVTELLKTMLANNLLLDESGRWASSTFEDIGINFEKIKVPQTLKGLLLERYKNLNVHERKILEWMAVLNKSASVTQLSVLSRMREPYAVFLSLTRDDLIERKNREQHYFFKNLLLRDVIYEALDSKQVEHMHSMIVHQMKDFLSEKERLFHEGQGENPTKAVAALTRLGEIYFQEDRFAEAASVLEAAFMRTKGKDSESQIALLGLLAEYTARNNRLREAILYYEQAKEYYDQSPDKGTLADRIKIYEKLGNIYARLNQFEDALHLFHAAIGWLQSVPKSDAYRIKVKNHLANIHMKSGEVARAESIFRENRKAWKSLSSEEQKWVDNNWLADVLIQKKEYVEALSILEEDIDFFEKVKDRTRIARSYYLKGDVLYKMCLDAPADKQQKFQDDSIAALEKTLQIAKENNDHDYRLRAYNGLANLYYHAGDNARATESYERAMAIARKMEDASVLATLAHNLANIYKKEKKYRDAHAYLVYGLNTLAAKEPKTSHDELNWFSLHCEMAENQMHLKNGAVAEEFLEKAQELLGSYPHLKLYAFWLWLLYARVYFKQDKKPEFEMAMAKAAKLAKPGMEAQEFETFVSETQWVRPQNVLESISISQNFPEGTPEALLNILRVNKFLNSEHDLNVLLKMILNYALELSGAERGLILLLNEAGELSVQASVNTDVTTDLSQISQTMAKRALETGETVSSLDSSQSVVLNEIQSVLCIPLKSKNKPLGVLYLDHRRRPDAFLEIPSAYLSTYADQAGLAIENARLIAALKHLNKKLSTDLEKAEGALEEANRRLESEMSVFMPRYSYDQIITKSKPMREVFKLLDKITETNLSVYLHGASGTGKELIAQALHYNHPARKSKHFVAVNCGAIPANLMESELFGHKEGSFTGATRSKKGLFEEANGGTLFLDEIAELDPSLQVKLLRALQEGEIKPIGDNKTISVDVRVICASHRNLENMVKEGTFREDLFYRLCQMKISIPSLADRKEDIPPLVSHFVDQFRKENKVIDPIKVSPNFLRALVHYPWPGNVRELENAVNVACALRTTQTLEVTCLPRNILDFNQKTLGGGFKSSIPLVADPTRRIAIDSQNVFDPQKTWAQYELVILAKCFEKCAFQKAKTAAMLGVSPSTLYNKIRDHKLNDEKNPIYQDSFVYEEGRLLRDYIPRIFKAALEYSDQKPYAALRRLGVSQGYFYKILKQA